jgi:hypothetical protein
MDGTNYNMNILKFAEIGIIIVIIPSTAARSLYRNYVCTVPPD